MSEALRGAVLGHPIGHSKSPQLHSAAYAALGIDYNYAAFDVEVPALAAFLAEVRSSGKWYGLSVTMPLKNAAVDLVDELTPVARALGAVNTVIVTTHDGATHLRGDNTDVAGIVKALLHAGVRERPRAAILGGGGTAVSAVAALGALKAPVVDLFVRNRAKAGDTLEVARALGVPAELVPFDGAAHALAGYDVVISTLPPHGADAVAEEFSTQAATVSGACLLDVAYDPWPSALATSWQAKGGTVVPGIEMLLYQGVEQVKLFAGAGGYQDRVTGRVGDILNVMCDALGLARRPPYEWHA
ncbi:MULTISPECIES: shikimate dehydrogenase [Arthrobacter]|uniref:shikimate dehydrogenase n=1 Tax=Arthrobacter TaxID=1663 RepID=UPI0012B5E137|nr:MULTISPECIES: shikimate dehydrogenase [Arthrobacter]